ncbi:hypothetical protein EJ05DRAFT_495635 [Pseudovirgaria hyperparasitica]|uniref:ribonuclease T1 n=1 Tax=Pseudovirgaria hyperparasitica TaxID=470096 RepID=A0A6A6WKP6_9PEZI|nr:uncharacterized protein EJ05DRAFT_495635 [Pseudovirgaria hyperparasitica]KAF2762774.1 hypothetical protein EJ05DRAFT_495635 [Pseudovirgaria hyperparasitica]
MLVFKAFLALVPLVASLPVELDTRAGTTCGGVFYTSSEVSAASNQAYNYYKSGTQVGSNNYPHAYNNYEGFNFDVSGPYLEFPIKKGGVYTGGSPGADRVVINTSGAHAGDITHTGASSNNFVGCSGTS